MKNRFKWIARKCKEEENAISIAVLFYMRHAFLLCLLFFSSRI